MTTKLSDGDKLRASLLAEDIVEAIVNGVLDAGKQHGTEARAEWATAFLREIRAEIKGLWPAKR